MIKYYGKRVFEGIVIGKIIRLDSELNINNLNFEGYDKELQKFNIARQKTSESYRLIYNKSLNESNEISSDIILSFISLLDDLDFIETVEKYLKTNICAEDAVLRASEELQEIFRNLDNPYLKERAKDIKEICKKVINNLQNNKNNFTIDKPTILITSDMLISDFMELDKKNILGIVFENVSPNSHIAILARSLSIPSIASVSEKIVDNSSDCILDSKNGLFIVDPDKDLFNQYLLLKKEREQLSEQLIKYKNINVKTVDNKTIKVFANISSKYEIQTVLDNNADGIGLFRSEFLYLNNHNFPTEEEQFEHYKEVVSQMKEKPTIIRTMDIGADKKVDYFKLPSESNPFLGYRGVRIYKEYLNVFIAQLRALLRASVYGNLKIMIPMINSVDEVKFIKSTINDVKNQLSKEKINFNPDLEVGIMIETPAAALICDELAQYVDFFSIGTNDLSQYVLAIDRENSKLVDQYNPNHKAILRLIYHISKIANEHNIKVGICGEIAREKELLGFFINCGIEELSVSSSYILECKKNIADIDTNNYLIKKFI